MLQAGTSDAVAHPRLLTDAGSIWAALSRTHGASVVVEVRMVRLTWLLERATKRQHLPRRADMEADSGSDGIDPFISPQELRELPRGFDGQLPILAVQAVMTTAESFSGQWLMTLAATIEELQTCEAAFQRFPAEAGVFIEWCSLPQPDKKTGRRTVDEQAAFAAAVSSLHLWYSHSLTTVVLHGGGVAAEQAGRRGSQTQQAAAVVERSAFPPCAEAMTDGWFAFGRGLSAIRNGVTSSPMCGFLSWPQFVEVGVPNAVASRRPPPPPSHFGAFLDTKAWPGGEANARLATDLYGQALASHLSGLLELRLVDEDWTDDEVTALAALLPLCPRVTHLTVNVELLSEQGYAALGAALNAGALPALEYLSIGQHILSIEALPLLEALGGGEGEGAGGAQGGSGGGGLPNLRVLNLFGMLIEDAPLNVLAQALGASALPALEDVQIWTQKSGAAGVMALVEQLRQGAAPKLRFVDMSGETTKPAEGGRRSSKFGASEHKSAGKGPVEAMRRACGERGVEFALSNATSYKI